MIQSKKAISEVDARALPPSLDCVGPPLIRPSFDLPCRVTGPCAPPSPTSRAAPRYPTQGKGQREGYF